MMAVVNVWRRMSVLASTTNSYTLLGKGSNWTVTTHGELAQSGGAEGTGLVVWGHKVLLS